MTEPLGGSKDEDLFEMLLSNGMRDTPRYEIEIENWIDSILLLSVESVTVLVLHSDPAYIKMRAIRLSP